MKNISFILVLILLSINNNSFAAPSNKEVKAMINQIQTASKASDTILKSGRTQDLHNHSSKFIAINNKAESMFKPLDFENGADCLNATIKAKLIWQTKMSYKSKPDQYCIDNIKRTTKQYNEDIAGCKEYAAKLKK